MHNHGGSHRQPVRSGPIIHGSGRSLPADLSQANAAFVGGVAMWWTRLEHSSVLVFGEVVFRPRAIVVATRTPVLGSAS